MDYNTGLTYDGSGSVMDEVVENGYTVQEILRIMAAALAGKVSGASTATITFKGVDGVTDRIIGTVDGDGNRTAVTLDAS